MQCFCLVNINIRVLVAMLRQSRLLRRVKPFVPVAEFYAGDLGSCQAFLSQMFLVFDIQSEVCNSYAVFTDEMKKVFDHATRGKDDGSDSAPINAQSSIPELEPMQLRQAQLTPQDKHHHRTTNAYFYCGNLGHFVTTCTTQRAKGLDL
uniref:CCHC-type domain-containing protein n=1 Tax=Amphiprion ocellaris TaxID=80972 RepID=A0AAQ5XL16_AMPOC